MIKFHKYKRTNIAEMREVTRDEIKNGLDESISVSKPDLENGSPLPGDMVARNPENHDDQWLVAADYAEANFKLI